MLYSLDRFEGDVAVLVGEDETTLSVPCGELPSAAKPGDMLRPIDGVYAIDTDATQARREQILRLQRKLRRS